MSDGILPQSPSKFERLLHAIPNKESGYLHIYGLFYLIQYASQKFEFSFEELENSFGFKTEKALLQFENSQGLQGGSILKDLFQADIAKCVFEGQCQLIDTISANLVLLFFVSTGILLYNTEDAQFLIKKVRKFVLLYLVLVLFFSLAGSYVSEEVQAATEISRIGYVRESFFGIPSTRLCSPSEYSYDVATDTLDYEPLGISQGCNIRKIGIKQNVSFLMNSFYTIISENFDLTRNLSIVQAAITYQLEGAKLENYGSNAIISLEDTQKLLELSSLDATYSAQQKLKNINEMIGYTSALSSGALLTASSIILYAYPFLLDIQNLIQKKLGRVSPKSYLETAVNYITIGATTVATGYNIYESVKTEAQNVLKTTLGFNLGSAVERFSTTAFALRIYRDPILNDSMWMPFRAAFWTFLIVVLSYFSIAQIGLIRKRSASTPAGKTAADQTGPTAAVTSTSATVAVTSTSPTAADQTGPTAAVTSTITSTSPTATIATADIAVETQSVAIVNNFAQQAALRSNRGRAASTGRPRATSRSRSKR